ncbi:MAG TPA: SRPBCC domain-containing protein [Chitinophagaceae bacterium]|nr:SRPBCC domain-containing protein [Chitinophagaceae bacterium]
MKTKEIEFAQTKNTFSMTGRVETAIHAKAEDIWKLLTDAKRFSSWNSTISAIDGNIQEGERIRIHVPGTDRTFTPKVSGIVPNKSMTWSNGFAPIFKGSRSFELRQDNNGSTGFIMAERFSGLVFALIKNKLPDFRLIFERYALDLKKEAELRSGRDEEIHSAEYLA